MYEFVVINDFKDTPSETEKLESGAHPGLGLHPGAAPWGCTLRLHPGAAPWGCTLGLHPGAAPWGCTLGLHPGGCTLGLHPGGWASWLLTMHPEPRDCWHCTLSLVIADTAPWASWLLALHPEPRDCWHCTLSLVIADKSCGKLAVLPCTEVVNRHLPAMLQFIRR